MTPPTFIVAHLLCAFYFVFRLVTAPTVLPKPRPQQQRIPRAHFLVALALAAVPPALVRAPFFIASWIPAALTAIRFAYDAPLFVFETADPVVLHYPRVFLWRVDIVGYVLFILARVAAPPSALYCIILAGVAALVVVTVLIIDVALRLGAQSIRVNPMSLVSALFASGPLVQYPTEAPPTVYDAPAYVLLSFDWATRTIVTGRERPLEVSDILPMPEKYRSHVSATERFEPHWQAQLSKAPSSKPSIGRALFSAFGVRLLLGGLLKVVNDVCLFISPIILKNVSFPLFSQVHTPSPTLAAAL